MVPLLSFYAFYFICSFILSSSMKRSCNKFFPIRFRLNAVTTSNHDIVVSSSKYTQFRHYTSNNITKSASNQYSTLDISDVVDARYVIVRSPTPKEYEFDLDSSYSHEIDDVSTEEVQFGHKKEQNNKSRLNKFLGGRVALRRALRSLQVHDIPHILRDDWGAPTLPSYIAGSISHKDDLAVGVARVDGTGRIGVDLEHMYNKAASTLWRRILTAGEQERVGRLPDTSMEEETLLRFSFKEAVYKAIHPFLRRSVDFTEVEVDPQPDGSARITFLLKTGQQFEYKASWQRFRLKYWLTCVYLKPLPAIA